MPVFLSVFALAQYVRPSMASYSALIRYPQRLPVGYGTRCRVRSEYPAVFRAHVSSARYLLVKKCISKTCPLFSRVFNALFLLYAIIQSSEVQHSLTNVSSQGGLSHLPVKVLTTALPIVISIAELAYITLAWTIYNEFGWKVYKFLGADRQIKKMFAAYQIYQCLIKFDIFFWVGFCVQIAWLVLNGHSLEFYITGAALVLSVVLLVEGHLAARYENKWMMISFLSGCVAAMVYFCYKVWLLLYCLLPSHFGLLI